MRVSLVVSDVDGTLVDPDKNLTPATVAAVQALRARGVGFSVISSRPPLGLRMLVAPLGLALPMGAFNGSTLVHPDLSVIAEALIPADAAREAVAFLEGRGVDAWVFAHGRWQVRDPAGAYTDRERHTLQAEPEVVADLGPLLGAAAKITGVSRDFAKLADCETALAAALGDRATVHRSQAYYLDVTPPGVDKGTAVAAIAKAAGVPLAETLTLGDMANDVPMFRVAGRGVAMGNATDAVKAAAGDTTAANDADGFAEAIARFVLGT
jgi:Cof subfamily protein (haloacid dehalogenase superfamily)